MGRMHPVECEHGNIVDPGSFDIARVGCTQCDRERERREQQAFDDAMDLERLRQCIKALCDATGEHDWEAATAEAISRMGKLEAAREALDCLLPGLILDLRYASPDDDRDAMQSRIKTVTEALEATK